jgi:hypothetical protein
MKKMNVLLANLMIAAFLIMGFAQPAAAQQKMPKQGTKRMMPQQSGTQMPMNMQKTGMPGKKMGMKMGHKNMEMMQMMSDPVIKSLHSYGCPGFLLKHTAELGLTDAQTKTLNNLELEFKKAATKIKAEIKVASLDIQEAMNTNQPDFGKVKSFVKKIDDLQQQLHTQFLNTLIKARKSLDSQQLSKLNALPKGMPGHGMMK